MDVLILNTEATRFRRDPSLVGAIRDLLPENVLVMETDSEIKTIRLLAGINVEATNYVYVAGGDGTFRTVLNWVMTVPAEQRPAISPVGGGNICYMAAHVGFRSNDPLWNLQQLFSNGQHAALTPWRPLQVNIVEEGRTIYCAVFGNGLLYDFLYWMQGEGRRKGIRVIGMMLKSAVKALISTDNTAGDLKGTSGEVYFDGHELPSSEYIALLLSTVSQMSYGSRPFHGELGDDQFWSVAYWGSYRRLATFWPFLWFGRVPFWAKDCLWNAPRERVTIITQDERYMVDGCCKTVDSRVAFKNDGVVRFVITIGEPVLLLGLN